MHKTQGEVILSDLKGPFQADTRRTRYSKTSIHETCRKEREIGPKTRDTNTEATAHCMDEMAKEYVAVKRIIGDGAEELG